jgi:hypothetical protein
MLAALIVVIIITVRPRHHHRAPSSSSAHCVVIVVAPRILVVVMKRASGQVLHIVLVQARRHDQRECMRVEVVAYHGVPRCRSFHHLIVVMEGTWGQVLSTS